MDEFNPSPEFEEKVRKALAVPDANPDFIDQLHNQLAGRPVRMKSRFVLKPAWAFALAILLIAFVASAPIAVNALKKLLGYVPGVGLVENNGNLRMLAEPASVTRNGVTVTVTQAMVYADHVELTYTVQGVSESQDMGSNTCGFDHPNNDFWSDADADLRLPNGTIVRRDYAGKYQSANMFAMQPVYAVTIPSNVLELRMVLKCIPFTQLGTAPENWEVPFRLVAIPAGTVVGAPVIEVEATSAPATPEPAAPTAALPSPKINMTLERIVPLDSGMIFYIHFNVDNPDPSLISIMPASAYLVDSLGQKTQLRGDFIWQPFEHRVGSSFEYTLQTKPADGPLTLVVENAVAYYAPLYSDPPQATPEQMSFAFEAGSNPQYGQTWQINKDFMIAGYPIHVLSARAANWADIETPNFLSGSQGYEYGYEFTVETDPSVKMLMRMDIMSESPSCGLSNGQSIMPDSSSIHYTELCRDAYPKGDVRVTIAELSVLVNNTLQVSVTAGQ